jgi:hypothetical protein
MAGRGWMLAEYVHIMICVLLQDGPAVLSALAGSKRSHKTQPAAASGSRLGEAAHLQSKRQYTRPTLPQVQLHAGPKAAGAGQPQPLHIQVCKLLVTLKMTVPWRQRR